MTADALKYGPQMGLDPLRVVGGDYGYDQCWRTDRIRPRQLRYVC